MKISYPFDRCRSTVLDLTLLNRPGFVGGSNSREDGAMTSKTANEFAPEVRSRAVRMVFEHEGEHDSCWAAITSIAAKIGCTPETLRLWVKRA